MRSVRSISPTSENSLRARSRISTGTCTPQACHAKGTAAPAKTEQSPGRGGPLATLLLSGAEGQRTRRRRERVALLEPGQREPRGQGGRCRWRTESSQYARVFADGVAAGRRLRTGEMDM
jgi:predicted CxxxxCH...CXXCH cytochrome family protein